MCILTKAWAFSGYLHGCLAGSGYMLPCMEWNTCFAFRQVRRWSAGPYPVTDRKWFLNQCYLQFLMQSPQNGNVPWKLMKLMVGPSARIACWHGIPLAGKLILSEKLDKPCLQVWRLMKKLLLNEVQPAGRVLPVKVAEKVWKSERVLFMHLKSRLSLQLRLCILEMFPDTAGRLFIICVVNRIRSSLLSAMMQKSIGRFHACICAYSKGLHEKRIGDERKKEVSSPLVL